MAKKRGDRFRLLIYERMAQRWTWACIVIAIASFVLWWFAPRAKMIREPYRPLILIPGLAALTILAYVFLARRLAWVQCRPNQLRIQAPIYRLDVSYSRIKTVRPSTLAQAFDPAAQKSFTRGWLQPYWGKTAIMVELSKYPLDERWLRLWFNRFLFAPTGTGFVLLVEDWMGLSRQLDDFRSDWAMRRAERRRQRQSY